MSKQVRLTLFLFGLLLVFLSLAALSFAFQPVTLLHSGATVAPTLFTLPPGGVP